MSSGMARWCSSMGLVRWGAQQARTYDGGVEQLLFHQKATLRARYFHNEFGNQVEFVDTESLTLLGVPQPVVDTLNADFVFGAYVNSLSYRAQGVESEVEAQPCAACVSAGGVHMDRVEGAAVVFVGRTGAFGQPCVSYCCHWGLRTTGGGAAVSRSSAQGVLRGDVPEAALVCFTHGFDCEPCG